MVLFRLAVAWPGLKKRDGPLDTEVGRESERSVQTSQDVIGLSQTFVQRLDPTARQVFGRCCRQTPRHGANTKGVIVGSLKVEACRQIQAKGQAQAKGLSGWDVGLACAYVAV